MTAPLHLDEEAIREWDRLAPIVAAGRPLNGHTRAVLGLYCRAKSRMIQAERIIKSAGNVLKTTDGVLYQNPFVAVADRARNEVRILGVDLGLDSDMTREDMQKAWTEFLAERFGIVRQPPIPVPLLPPPFDHP